MCVGVFASVSFIHIGLALRFVPLVSLDVTPIRRGIRDIVSLASARRKA
jgi:hypothetical protein